MSRKDEQMRFRIAEEAARILAADGARSFHAAKQKAAERLGAPNTRHMPSNDEVEAALSAYQRLFQGDEQTAWLTRLRTTAIAAMKFFDKFSPRLVGSVLSGTATAQSDINLHVFTDSPEELELFLMEHRIPFEHALKRYYVASPTPETYPVVRFVAEETPIEVTVFPTVGLRQSARRTADGDPIKRAPLKTVEALLDTNRV